LNGFSLSTAEPLQLNGAGTLINSSSTNVIYKGLISLGASSSIISNAGAIDISNTTTILGATFDLTLGGTATNCFVRSIIGTTTGGVIKVGSGDWTISGKNTYTGSTSVNAGTINLGIAQVLSGKLDIASGAKLDTKSFGLTFNGNFLNSGTFVAGNSVITIGGTATQSIAGFSTTSDVLVTKTGGVATLTGNVTAGGDLSIINGNVLTLGTGLTHNTNTLTLGGNIQSVGSWGSTSSSATNKNNTYFGPDTGIVNVASSTCTTGYWTGLTGTNWNNASNWCGGIPLASTNVVIPSGLTNMPVIAAGTTAVANNITVNGTLTLANDATALLNISGNFINNGVFTAGVLSKTSFIGTTSQDVDGVTYGELIFSGSGLKTLKDALIVGGPMTINSGATFVTGDFPITFQGNFVKTGTFTAGNSDIIIAGVATTQSIAGFTTTGDVSMTKTGGTATFANLLNIGSLVLNGNGGSIDLGSFTHSLTGDLTLTQGTLLANSSTLNIQGDVTKSAGVFTSGTSTVVLNDDDQSIGALNFYNLTLSGTGTKTFLNATATSNNLLIASGVMAELGPGLTHTANKLTLGATVVSSGSWGSTSSSATNMNDVYFDADDGVINVSTTTCTPGLWTGLTSTDWSDASNWCGGVPTATTNVVIPTGAPRMPLITAITAVCKDLTIQSSATLTLSNNAASLLNISGNFVSTGTFTANTLGTTSYVASANQTVAGVTYGNLTISGSGTKTLTAAIIVAGSMTINSGVALATANNSVTFQGNYVNSGGSLTAGSSAIIFAGTATQTIAGFTTTGTVSMTKTAGTATFGGAINGGGLTLNGSGGTLNLGLGLTHTFTGNWTRTNGTLNGSSSTLKIGGDVSGTVGTFTSGTGTVEFNKAGAQNLGSIALSYNNLTFSGSGTKTLGVATGITNLLAVSAGVVANLGTFTHTAKTLTLGGVGTISGSWGGTTSSATNINSTYFAVATGIINVSTGSCVLPVPTFTVSPSSSLCLRTSVTYTTQSGQMSYVWVLPGTSGVDYTITSGGIGSTSNTVTLSWLTTGSKTVTVNYKSIGGCTAVSPATNTQTVNADSGGISINGGTPTVSNGNITYCPQTAAVFSISPVALATTYTWSLPTGWKDKNGVAIVTTIDTSTPELTVITGTSSDSGTVSVKSNNLFCPSNLFVGLTDTAPSAPTFSVIQATCLVPTGTISVTSPANAPGRVYVLTTIPLGTSQTSATGEFSNLVGGDYIVTYHDGPGCVSASTATIPIIPLLTKKWDGTGWIDAITLATTAVPTVKDNVIFSGSFNNSGPINACTCVIDAAVTISSGVLNVIKGLTVNSSLTFEGGAYLVQNDNTNTNAGSITFKLSQPVVAYEYVYWSSPVSGGGLGAFSTVNKSFSFLNNAWVGANTSPGNGFIVRYVNAGTQAPNFVGVPNNGQITVVGSSTGSSLIGNPYPSPIYASSFVAQNSGLSGGLYIWNSGTTRTINGSGTKFVYNGSYSVVNGTGSVGMGDEIGPGVGFFVSGSGFVFNNDMRIAPPSGNGGNFSKIANTKKTKATEKNRVWLKLTKESEELSQLLVGYVTDATNDFDKLYDATAFGGTDFDFYSIANSKQYTIQGRGLPFDTADEIPLGYKTVLDGVLAVDIEKVDGNFVGESIYLEDKTTNTIHDLTKGPYSFTTAKGEFKDRFVLRYTDTAKLGTDEVTAKENGVMVSVKKRQIKINSFDQTLSAVKLFDVKGSLLYEKKNINTNEFKIDNLQSKTQFMIVMIQLENGKSISEKIIFQE
jgi:hypothetical protein